MLNLQLRLDIIFWFYYLAELASGVTRATNVAIATRWNFFTILQRRSVFVPYFTLFSTSYLKMSCTINIKEDYNEFSALKCLEHNYRND